MSRRLLPKGFPLSYKGFMWIIYQHVIKKNPYKIKRNYSSLTFEMRIYALHRENVSIYHPQGFSPPITLIQMTCTLTRLEREFFPFLGGQLAIYLILFFVLLYYLTDYGRSQFHHRPSPHEYVTHSQKTMGGDMN